VTPCAARWKKSIRFAVSGVPSGRHVRYDWAFSGGTATGQQVSRSYPDPGDYPVAVTVTVVSVAGLSGDASQLTVVVSNARPAKIPSSGSAGGQGSGSGTGNGHGSGNGSSKSAAARAARRAKQAATAAGVARAARKTRVAAARAVQREDLQMEVVIAA